MMATRDEYKNIDEVFYNRFMCAKSLKCDVYLSVVAKCSVFTVKQSLTQTIKVCFTGKRKCTLL